MTIRRQKDIIDCVCSNCGIQRRCEYRYRNRWCKKCGHIKTGKKIDTRIIKQCVICGKELLVPKCLIKRKQCCSIKCSIKTRIGKCLTEKHKNRISDSLINSEKHKLAMCLLERSQKLRDSKIGIKFTEKHRKALSISHIGYKVTEQQKCNMSKAQRKLISEGRHNFWQGGKSYEIYPVDWTKTLKIAIRERDNYTCQLCGEKQGYKAFCVHHIDYNKKNCKLENLITLCRNCHAKTNQKRQYWIEYFGRLLCLD